jgi:hypothetical protein
VRRVLTGEDLIRSGGPATVISSAQPRNDHTEVRSTPSPIEVTLTRSASERMRSDLFMLTRRDNLECGGFLFSAPTRSWDKSLRILDATGTGEAQRSVDYMWLDKEMWRSHELAYAIDGLDMQLCGLWHAHPNTRDGTPSSADLTALLGVLDWNQGHGRSAPCSVGLIYSASPYLGDSWARPRLHAWVVRREGQGNWAWPVCEPAEIRER